MSKATIDLTLLHVTSKIAISRFHEFWNFEILKFNIDLWRWSLNLDFDVSSFLVVVQAHHSCQGLFGLFNQFLIISKLLLTLFYTFSTVAPWNIVWRGVMGYVNLSIHIWKTSKKVSGKKDSMAWSRSHRSWKSKKISDLIILIFYFALQIWP